MRETAVQPGGQPPVRLAEQLHHRRHEHAQDERVQRDRHREADAELGDLPRPMKEKVRDTR